MKKLIVILCSVMTVGCAAPGPVDNEARAYLRGQCLDMFLKGWPLGYQHVVNRPGNPEAVFSVGTSADGRQICGMARNMTEVNGTGLTATYTGANLWAALESIAIANCEAQAPEGVRERCKIFARKNEIVWAQKDAVSKPAFR